jgi:AbiV family abortive infection protein
LKKIPRKLFREGIELIKKNVMDYLEEAKMIAQKGFLNHAYVSVQLAIEETGKIIWLKEEIERSETDPVEVSDVIFGINGKKSHVQKFGKAKEKLNPKLLWVCKGIFDPMIFNPKIFVGREASHETRLLNAYVNFDDKKQRWYIGCDIDKSRLEKLIVNIEKVVSTL